MYEILFALAAIANIGSFVLGLWQEYKHKERMVEEKKKRTGGNQS